MKDAILSVRIDAEIARLLRLKAEQDGVSLSDLIRDALKDALFDYDDVRPVKPWRPSETRSVTVASGAHVIWLQPLERVA